jgi:hypothetical protein
MKLLEFLKQFLPDIKDVLDDDTHAAAEKVWKTFKDAKRPKSEAGRKLSPAEKKALLGAIYELALSLKK